jgi:hypothetical protein
VCEPAVMLADRRRVTAGRGAATRIRCRGRPPCGPGSGVPPGRAAGGQLVVPGRVRGSSSMPVISAGHTGSRCATAPRHRGCAQYGPVRVAVPETTNLSTRRASRVRHGGGLRPLSAGPHRDRAEHSAGRRRHRSPPPSACSPSRRAGAGSATPSPPPDAVPWPRRLRARPSPVRAGAYVHPRWHRVRDTTSPVPHRRFRRRRRLAPARSS